MRNCHLQWTLALAIVASGMVLLGVPGCGEMPRQESASQADKLGHGTAGKFTSFAPAATCSPTGAHAKHGTYTCATCHFCAGTVSFDPAGPAVAAGQPAPTFDATAKTCSSVACHGVPAGTYSFYFPESDENSELQTVPFGGTAGATPSWYATGQACTACHDLTYQGAKYPWHSGQHGSTVPNGNACFTCHMDAIGTVLTTGPSPDTALNTANNCPPGSPYPGTTSCRSYHANGALNVNGRFTSRCFGCH